jgi:hypothetical protein
MEGAACDEPFRDCHLRCGVVLLPARAAPFPGSSQKDLADHGVSPLASLTVVGTHGGGKMEAEILTRMLQVPCAPGRG